MCVITMNIITTIYIINDVSMMFISSYYYCLIIMIAIVIIMIVIVRRPEPEPEPELVWVLFAKTYHLQVV